MRCSQTPLKDLLLLQPTVFGDDRGFFYESFNEKLFESFVGEKTPFVQDNHSKSQKGVLRGLHYQLAPFAQGKLVRVIQGSVFDVAVDLRKSSPSYLKWYGREISEENKEMLWIPEGFAHGFLVLSQEAEFLYKTTNYYHKESERSISWNDSHLNIDWPLEKEPLLSEKDKNGSTIEELELFV